MNGRKATGESTFLAERKRRAGQRLVLGFEGTGITPELKSFCREARPAGFILFARNVEEPAQVAELNRELESLLPDRLPPILSVDQEGGRVLRVRDTPWPPMRWLGNLGDPALTRRVGLSMGAELAAMRFNVDWAPVADVDSNPNNPVIGDRSFSRDPEICARHVCAYLDGLHKAGIAGCVKHFPGHGDTTVDSHEDLPVVEKDPDDLEHCEMVPFRAAIDANVPSVMAAHVLYPTLDPDLPASLSRPVLHDWLRTRLGFGGLIVSDDMEMGALKGRWALEQQLEYTTRASTDLLLFCHRLDLQVSAWETLVRMQEQDSTQVTIAEDTERRLGRFRERFFLERPQAPDLAVVGSRSYKDLAAAISQRGLA